MIWFLCSYHIILGKVFFLSFFLTNSFSVWFMLMFGSLNIGLSDFSSKNLGKIQLFSLLPSTAFPDFWSPNLVATKQGKSITLYNFELCYRLLRLCILSLCTIFYLFMWSKVCQNINSRLQESSNWKMRIIYPFLEKGTNGRCFWTCRNEALLLILNVKLSIQKHESCFLSWMASSSPVRKCQYGNDQSRCPFLTMLISNCHHFASCPSSVMQPSTRPWTAFL